MCIDPFLKRIGVHMLIDHLLFARLCDRGLITVVGEHLLLLYRIVRVLAA